MPNIVEVFPVPGGPDNGVRHDDYKQTSSSSSSVLISNDVTVKITEKTKQEAYDLP